MFEIDPKLHEDLSNGNISDELRQEIENNGISLSHDAIVSQKSANVWQIEDKDAEYFAISWERNTRIPNLAFVRLI